MNKAKKLALMIVLIFTAGCGQHDLSIIFGQQNEDELNDSSSSMNSISYASSSSRNIGSISSSSVRSVSSSSVTNLIPEEDEDMLSMNEEEMKLYEIMMQYREEKGLPRIPISKSLTYVAKVHVRDLHENYFSFDASCNLHSWSYNDIWTGCCYTPDQAAAAYMWIKPRELTSYIGNGYEIATGYSRSGYAMNAETALSGWQSSPGHNNTIINEDKWKDVQWNAVGMGIYKGFAVTWFGQELDECEVECNERGSEKKDFKWCVAENFYGLTYMTVCRELGESLTLEQCLEIGNGFVPRETPPENCTYF
jgi:uncharacterized protein YkwD